MTIVESQPFRPTPPATNKCGSNCGYAIFNNTGAGYKAATATCVAKITLATGDVATTDYTMMWRLSGLLYNCFQNETDALHKSFVSTPGKTYVFTAYFNVGKCPANLASVTITVDWQ